MRTLLVALTATVLLLAGCSGDDDASPTPAEPGSSAGTTGTAGTEGSAGSRIDLTGQGTFEPDGLFTVAPQHAELDGDELDVTVSLTAADLPLTAGTKRGLYAAGATLLDAADGPDVTVEPGATEEVVLRFPGAADATLDGQVTFEVSVDGQPATSVGFGLQAP